VEDGRRPYELRRPEHFWGSIGQRLEGTKPAGGKEILTDFGGQALKNLLRALKNEDVLPDQVLFDKYSSTWFDCLWRLSLIPSGSPIQPVREHGAALVEETDGSLQITTARPGSCEAFPFDEGEMQFRGFMGYFHTHPYESGTTGVAFSPGDFSAMINSQMRICIAQSGDLLFMLVRTPATPKCIDPDKILTEFDKWLADYQRKGKKWQAAVLLANLHICREYGLAFYIGRMHQPLQLSCFFDTHSESYVEKTKKLVQGGR